MKKFSPDKGYEEIDIDGDIFKVDLSDKARKEYQLTGHKVQEQVKSLEGLSDDATEEQQNKAIEELKRITKAAMDKVLGKGAFDKIYPKTNESVISTIDVLYDVVDYIHSKEQEHFDQKKAKYTKKKKK